MTLDPPMFHPVRFERRVVYDVRRLIVPRSVAEERVFVDAVRGIPAAFEAGAHWGEARDGSVWIDARLHDSIYCQIRARLRSDAGYVAQTAAGYRRAVAGLEDALAAVRDPGGRTRASIEALYASCAGAVAWFAGNWLHPMTAVRLAVARVFGSEELESRFGSLISPDGHALYVKACLAHSEVLDGTLAPAEFAWRWQPLFTAHRVAQRGALRDEAYLSADARRRIDAAYLDNRQSRDVTRARLLAAVTGPARELLGAQVEWLSVFAEQEEVRHQLQERAFALLGEIDAGR